ncbi:MAG: zinc-binding dehydrogenase, partial [Opitutales bacterium]|nr:zinc-binding dehydrogenase [Opitutales bacterium]
TVKPGDRVCCHWRPGEGLVGDPPKYKWATKTVNAGWIATFSDYAVISENRLTVVPKELDENFVALLADTITTGFGIVNNDAELKIGESFVIFGAGGIGMGAILGAKLAGAYPIIAVDLFDHKLEIAKKIGAHFIVNANDPHHVEQIENILNGKADVVAEGTGNPTVIEKCYSLTNPQGRTVLYGVMSHDKRVSIHTLPLHFGKVLTGSVGGSSLPTVEIPRYVKMFQNNIFEVNDFVSHTGQLDEVNELITKMRSGEVLHAMLDLR